jgi:hypothetical protein
MFVPYYGRRKYGLVFPKLGAMTPRVAVKLFPRGCERMGQNKDAELILIINKQKVDKN